MARPTTMTWGEEQVGMEKVWRCGCWDCAAHRRHVLRKVALVAVLLGLSCGWSIRAEAGHAWTVDEVAQVGGVTGPTWF